MTKIKKKKFKKKIFPIGIFLLLFLIQSIIAAGALSLYFLNTAQKRITDIEKYTQNYSMSMADLFADMAELSFRTRRYGKLKTTFNEKIRNNTIDEAFFVLNNGTIIAHSNSDIKKELAGNIANDEFTYNTDMILRPAKKKSRETLFTDYNIMGKQVPFTREERRLIKKHLYKKINSPGWLVSKAVYVRNKPVGTVNFIISKDRIFDFLMGHIDDTKEYLKYSLAGTFILSFLISLIVLVRYRMIQNRTIKISIAEKKEEIPGKEIEDLPDISEFLEEEGIGTPEYTEHETQVPEPENTGTDISYITIDLNDIEEPSQQNIVELSDLEIIEDDNIPVEKYEGEIFIEDLDITGPISAEKKVLKISSEIKDAIPVKKKEVS